MTDDVKRIWTEPDARGMAITPVWPYPPDNDIDAVEWVRADLSAPGWRTMETAPKDGTLFWGRDGNDAIAMLWHDDFEAFVSSWRQMTFAAAYGGGVRNHSPDIHRPSHWMPIPAPPKGE